MTCSQTVCTGSHIDQNQFQIGEDLKRKAKTYLTQFYKDHKRYKNKFLIHKRSNFLTAVKFFHDFNLNLNFA